MSFNTCPVATIDAPAERVWRLLAEPGGYAEWWDARTRSIIPEGPAQPGQQTSLTCLKAVRPRGGIQQRALQLKNPHVAAHSG